jgi:hypothetical protein
VRPEDGALVLHRNMSELRLEYSYIINTVHLVVRFVILLCGFFAYVPFHFA